MKNRAIIVALAALFSGAMFSACATDAGRDAGGTEEAQTGASSEQAASETGASTDQAEVPSVDGGVPVTEHQAEVVRDVEQRFKELDTDGDGEISRDEAQSMPALADYWEKNELSDDDTLDQGEFAQFESEMQTGVDMYETERKGPGDLPATKHQREATGAEDSGGQER